MKFTALLEALSSKQIDYVNRKLGGNSYSPYNSHSELFENSPYAIHGSNNKLVIPYNPELQPPVDNKVRLHLASHGWGIHDYVNGMAFRDTMDRNGNPKREFKKIGKVLQDTGAGNVIHSNRSSLVRDSDGNYVIDKYTGRIATENKPQSILEFYNNDPVRNSKSNVNIVISRDKEDIAGMSSGRSWEGDSCMRLPYSTSKEPRCQDTIEEHKHLKDDLKHHSLVAYATRKGDDYLEKPIGRVTIKKYESTSKVNGKKHVIYRVGSDEYGNLPHGFTHQVNEIMKAHYPAHSGVEYKLANGLYKERSQSEYISPVRPGLQTFSSGHTHRNGSGELHDFIDENGQHQPAYVYGNDISYRKNGMAHREGDLPAEITKNSNGSIQKLYKIHDELHRDGDKPAIETSDNSHSEWHLGGIPHRPNGKPQTIIRTDSTKKTQYVEYGLEHREGGLPSYEGADEHSIEKRYKVRGKFQSPDNNTPSLHIKYISGAEKGTELKEFHQNGLLHREDDKPAVIHTRNGTIVKKWYKNGELSRDGNKPHTVYYDKDTKKVLERHWHRPLDSKLPIRITTNDDGSIDKEYHHKTINTRPNGIVRVSKSFNDNSSHVITESNGYTSIQHKGTTIRHIEIDGHHYIMNQYNFDQPKFFKIDSNGTLIKAFSINGNGKLHEHYADNAHLTDAEKLKTFIDSHENGNLDHMKSSHKSMLTDINEISNDTKVPISIRRHFKELHSNLNRG